ncbi:ricin B lectin domain-containing protein [Cercophora samala]|uniref:Ricin B lectin domain-containing protein n=1 Tax=Cercophora samala TaxID=330535 RepID=A0AA39YVP8_9PEZI|nr:ricin B lectin domain-containing protein [Cercophora samala]
MAEPEQDYFLPDEWNGRVVYFFSESTGNVLDLHGGQSHNGNQVQGWSYLGSVAQQWRLQKVDSGPFGAWVLHNVGSGTVLDLNDGSPENCARIQGWKRYPGNGNQEWLIITKQYNDGSRCILQNRNSFTVADIAEGKRDNGNPVIGYQREAWNKNQLWRIKIA